jgi:hypothetical protein
MRRHRTCQSTAGQAQPESLLSDLAGLDFSVRKRLLHLLGESREREERLVAEIRRLRVELTRADAAFVYAWASGIPAGEASGLAAAGHEERARQRQWTAIGSSPRRNGDLHPATVSRRVA